MTHRSLRAGFSCVCLLLASSCQKAGLPSGAIVVTPSAASISADQGSLTFTVGASDANGNAIPSPAVEISTDSPIAAGGGIQGNAVSGLKTSSPPGGWHLYATSLEQP